MGGPKKSQSSKSTTASNNWSDCLSSWLLGPGAEGKRAASVDNNTSSLNVLGTTTRSDRTNVTNNYSRTEGGISAKDTAILVGVGAAVVAGGCLLGAHLTSGSASNNDGPGGTCNNHSARPDQQAPTPRHRHSGRGVDTATTEETVVVETPHIKVRAVAAQKQSRSRRRAGSYSAESSTQSAKSAESENIRALKAEALQIIRS